MIELRNLPDELDARLRRRSAASGLTLAEYVREILEREVSRPTWEEWLEELAELPPLAFEPDPKAAVRELRGDLCDAL